MDLGHAVSQLGSPVAAADLFYKAAAIQQRASGSDSWEVAIALVYHAATRFDRGAREQGRELLQEVSWIEGQRCDHASPDLPSSLLNVAAAALRGTPRPHAALSPTAAGCRMPSLAITHLTICVEDWASA
jgi:hypothetical protein